MNENYKDIQGILALSDIHPADCIKINNLIIELIKENKELKLQLKGTTHCFDEEEHEKLKKQLHEASLTIQEMAEQDIECPSNCEKLRQLKKQLEEKENIDCNWKDRCLENAGKIEILENQQKEFTNYLEDKINYYKRNTQCFSMNLIEEILRKYKSVIGVSDENN